MDGEHTTHSALYSDHIRSPYHIGLNDTAITSAALRSTVDEKCPLQAKTLLSVVRTNEWEESRDEAVGGTCMSI